jgi:uncharacterized protein with HEPN domain
MIAQVPDPHAFGAMANQVTIYDVAREAGVSISTVSTALNRPDKVSPTTRERILGAADRLGFVPKPAAISQAHRGDRRRSSSAHHPAELIEIGEAAKDLPADLTAAEPDLPWREIAGMRDQLAHRYFDTSHAILTATVRNDLPELRAAVERLLHRGDALDSANRYADPAPK